MNRFARLGVAAMAVAAFAAFQPAQAQQGTPAETLTDIEQRLGFVPDFLTGLPEHGAASIWAMMKELELSQDTALSGKEKSLIGLAVAAQIPCHYCIHAYTQSAKAYGASDEEIGEAVAIAAYTRMGSTMLNGLETDMDRFRADIDRLVAGD